MANNGISFRMLKEEEELSTLIGMMTELNSGLSEETLNDRLQEMISQGYECLGAFNSSLELIGVSGLWTLTKFYSGKFIEPDNVFIKSEYRSQGVGEKMMSFIEGLAKERGCDAVELNCYLDNTRGQMFWTNQGFTALGYHYVKRIT